MTQMINAVRDWLLKAQPILSGRIIQGTDGRMGRFQEVKKGKQGRGTQKNPKLVPSNRAYLTMHHDIYGVLDSHQYAQNHLAHGKRTVEAISDDVAQLVAHSLEKRSVPRQLAHTNALM